MTHISVTMRYCVHIFMLYIFPSLSIICTFATPLSGVGNSLRQITSIKTPDLLDSTEARNGPFHVNSRSNTGDSGSNSDSDPGPSDPGQNFPSQLHPGPGPRPASILSAWFRLPQDWSITAWHTKATFLPMNTAASALQSFYQDVFETAAARFWQGRSSPIWRFTSGGLSLWASYHPSSDAGSIENHPHISMAIVASLAFSLVELTKRGYAATFVAYIVDPEGNAFLLQLDRNESS